MYSQVAVGSVAADANSGPATVNVGFLIMGRLVAVPWAGYLERKNQSQSQSNQIKSKSKSNQSHLVFMTSKITYFTSLLLPAAVTAAVKVCLDSRT
jgi:hypothetical protein